MEKLEKDSLFSDAWLENWIFILKQMSLSIPFIADMVNKFFVFTCNKYVFMTIIKNFNLFLFWI